MKIIEVEVLLVVVGTALGFISAISYIFGYLYPVALYASLFCLYAAKWVEIADRIEIKK